MVWSDAGWMRMGSWRGWGMWNTWGAGLRSIEKRYNAWETNVIDFRYNGYRYYSTIEHRYNERIFESRFLSAHIEPTYETWGYRTNSKTLSSLHPYLNRDIANEKLGPEWSVILELCISNTGQTSSGFDDQSSKKYSHWYRNSNWLEHFWSTCIENLRILEN